MIEFLNNKTLDLKSGLCQGSGARKLQVQATATGQKATPCSMFALFCLFVFPCLTPSKYNQISLISRQKNKSISYSISQFVQSLISKQFASN